MELRSEICAVATGVFFAHSVKKLLSRSFCRNLTVYQSVSRSLACVVVHTWQCLSQSVSQLVNRSLMCIAVDTCQRFSLPVNKSLVDISCRRHVTVSQSASQPVARWLCFSTASDIVWCCQSIIMLVSTAQWTQLGGAAQWNMCCCHTRVFFTLSRSYSVAR